MAGGVSDGGGSTSTQNEVTPQIIIESMKTSGPMLLTWLYRRHQLFQELAISSRESSPFKILFSSPHQNIFTILQSTDIEVRSTKPCYDKSGRPIEGSIYASKADSMCLSPFLMAKKLVSSNIAQETAGLIIHELSHLLGANEEEANTIQNCLLNDLKATSPETIALNFNYLVNDSGQGKIYETALPTTFWEKDPANYLTFKDCFSWMKDLARLKDAIMYQPQPIILFASPEIMKLYQPQFAKLAVIQLFISAHDKNVSSIERKASQDLLDKLFFDTDEKTASEIGHGLGVIPTSDYDLITIKKPKEWSDISQLLGEMRNYLFSIQSDILKIKNFSFNIRELN
jgi:hypothetical protein